jgi:hypothetical protein
MVGGAGRMGVFLFAFSHRLELRLLGKNPFAGAYPRNAHLPLPPSCHAARRYGCGSYISAAGRILLLAAPWRGRATAAVRLKALKTPCTLYARRETASADAPGGLARLASSQCRVLAGRVSCRLSP